MAGGRKDQTRLLADEDQTDTQNAYKVGRRESFQICLEVYTSCGWCQIRRVSVYACLLTQLRLTGRYTDSETNSKVKALVQSVPISTPSIPQKRLRAWRDKPVWPPEIYSCDGEQVSGEVFGGKGPKGRKNESEIHHILFLLQVIIILAIPEFQFKNLFTPNVLHALKMLNKCSAKTVFSSCSRAR